MSENSADYKSIKSTEYDILHLWPRFDDGAPVMFGDAVMLNGRPDRVRDFIVDACGFTVCGHESSEAFSVWTNVQRPSESEEADDERRRVAERLRTLYVPNTVIDMSRSERVAEWYGLICEAVGGDKEKWFGVTALAERLANLIDAR